jgi:phosphatidylinositol glycan class C protein
VSRIWRHVANVADQFVQDPDNYTDEETFLDALQRNPRVQQYDFWPLFGDSMVIVQQVCTMIVFVCCFSGIIQEKVSAITVVSVGSVGTVLGWVLWDMWVEEEEPPSETSMQDKSYTEPMSRTASQKDLAALGLHLANHSNLNLGKQQMNQSRRTSLQSARLGTITEPHTGQNTPKQLASDFTFTTFSDPTSRWSPRTQRRLATAKSAVLIYCALLGLSPILKSLTKSTASDSIWAISFWLMCINVIFFDYGRGVGANFPASLSTNAALMASTVLASRLESTRHVFSLTLFSIEVFGLFPVFRRYLRYFSWRGHLCLTWVLVMGAGGGVALVVTDGGWKSAVVGVVLGQILTAFAMGLCSWWLIGLQRYKNEIYGPWDPARPIIRRWD